MVLPAHRSETWFFGVGMGNSGVSIFGMRIDISRQMNFERVAGDTSQAADTNQIKGDR